MIEATLKLERLISWGIIYEIIVEDQEVYVYYYPNSDKYYRVKLDAQSIATLKEKRQQIIDFLEQEVTLSGEILEQWEKRIVTKTKDVEDWVRVV